MRQKDEMETARLIGNEEEPKKPTDPNLDPSINYEDQWPSLKNNNPGTQPTKPTLSSAPDVRVKIIGEDEWPDTLPIGRSKKKDDSSFIPVNHRRPTPDGDPNFGWGHSDVELATIIPSSAGSNSGSIIKKGMQ